MSPFIMRRFGLSRARKRALQVGVDSLLLVAVFAASMWLRLEHLHFFAEPWIWLAILPVVPFTLLLFIRFGLYRAVLHYVAARAVAIILLGSVLSGLALFLTVGALGLPVPGSVPVIYASMTFLCIGASRFGLRQLLVTRQYSSKKQAVIYGAGDSGRQLLEKLRRGTEYQPIAFVDDSVSMRGTIVDGLRVYDPAELGPLMQSNGVEAVLLALPFVSNARRHEILKTLQTHAVHVRSIPDGEAILSGKVQIDQLHEIGLEDLIGRDPIVLRDDGASANICGKVVMVTGAGGAIGSALCGQILRQLPRHLVLFDQSAVALYMVEQQLIAFATAHGIDAQITSVIGSVQAARRVDRTLRVFKVQTLYHAAASQDTPLVEGNIVESIRNTVFGTVTVAEAAVAAGVGALILISTDKALRPCNVLMAARRMAEMVCQSLAQSQHCSGTTLSIVRIGNLLGASGSIVALLQGQIAASEMIRLPHPEMTRYFMTVREAAELVLMAGDFAKTGQVFVLDMGDPVRITELAAQMARLHGLTPVAISARRDAKNRRRQIRRRQSRRGYIGRNQIGMVFSELRPGEMLCEVPLLGSSPQATAHPRIMVTTEICQTPEDLAVTLQHLEMACDRNDIGRICALLAESQTGYQPQQDIGDYTGRQDGDGDAAQVAGAARLPLARNPPKGGGLVLA